MYHRLIKELLDYGAENARTGRELARALNIDRRSVVAAVERERREGAWICATTCGENAGYYLASDEEEARRYFKRLRGRGLSMLQTVAAMKKVLDKMPAEVFEIQDQNKSDD